jgi:PEP-CTERM motif
MSIDIHTPIKWTKNRTALGLLSTVAMLCSTVSAAQLKPADHGAAAIDNHGLMWANTVGINLAWNPAGGPDTAQGWVANLNATDYGGFNDWTLATGDFNVAPNTTTNQLGELFYTDCGNAVDQQTALTIPRSNCRALSALRPVINAGMGPTPGSGFPGAILISSSTFLGQDFPGCNDWAVYDTSNSSQRSWTCDTSFNGVVGEGDVLAVRLAGNKPHTTSPSAREVALRSVPEPGTFVMLAMGTVGLVLRWWGYRRKPT